MGNQKLPVLLIKILVFSQSFFGFIETNKFFVSALHLAAMKNDANVITLLSTYMQDLDVKNGKGETPLMLSAMSGQTEGLLALVKTGKVDVSQEGGANGKTILHEVARNGCEEGIFILADHGLKGKR